MPWEGGDSRVNEHVNFQMNSHDADAAVRAGVGREGKQKIPAWFSDLLHA